MRRHRQITTPADSGRRWIGLRAAFGRRVIERILELLSGAELGRAAGGDLDRLASFRIASNPRGPFRNRKRAETRDVNAVALLERCNDVVEQKVNRLLGVGFVEIQLVGKPLD